MFISVKAKYVVSGSTLAWSVNRNTFISLRYVPLLLFFICFFSTILVSSPVQVRVFQSVAIEWGQNQASICPTVEYLGHRRGILWVCSGSCSQKQDAHFSNCVDMLLLLISVLYLGYCGMSSSVTTQKKTLFLYSHLAVLYKLHF